MKSRHLLFFLPLLLACGPFARLPGEATPASAGMTPAEPDPTSTVVAAAQASHHCAAGDPSSSGLTGHQVFRAFSQDGYHFTAEDRLLVDQASVPDGVIGPDGAVWLYYVNGQPGHHGIFVARELSDGRFQVVDCVLIDGAFEGNAVDPDIMRLADGSYRLFYFLGNFVGDRQPETRHTFYSASSHDGLNFTLEGAIFTYEAITDPSVVSLPNGEWLLAAAQPELQRSVLARSSDGQHFVFQEEVAISGIPELALMPDGALRLYLQESLISTDSGYSWRVEEPRWVPGPDPSLVQLGPDAFIMFYKRFAADQSASPP